MCSNDRVAQTGNVVVPKETGNLTLRYLFSIALAVASISSVGQSIADTTLPSFDRVRVLEKARSISDAELVDQDGKPLKLSELKGRVVFVFFGFTNCPDVCPLAMEKFRQLRRSGLVDVAEVAFVLISVDGDRDSPAVLKSYLADYSPDFIGLTGSTASVKPIAKQFSVSFYKGNESADGYTVSHSPQAFLLDKSGQLRAELYSASVEAMAGIANALYSE